MCRVKSLFRGLLYIGSGTGWYGAWRAVEGRLRPRATVALSLAFWVKFLDLDGRVLVDIMQI